jgi:hypothetical protein
MIKNRRLSIMKKFDVRLGPIRGFIFDITHGFFVMPQEIDEMIVCCILAIISFGAIVGNLVILLY